MKVQISEITESQPGLDWLHARYIAPLMNREPELDEPVSTDSVDTAEIERALGFIKSDEYDTYLRVGMALKAGGCDQEVWDEWSATSPKFDAGVNTQKWKSFRTEGITLGTVFYLAQQGGYKRTENSPHDWAEPILFESKIPTRLSSDIFPRPLAEFAKALAAAVQVPIELVIMLLLSVLATVAQRRFVLCPYDTGYTEPVNIWTITVLPPGSRKSEVFKQLTSPLSQWSLQEEQRVAPINSRNKIEREILEKRIDSLKKRAANSDDETERQSLTSEAWALEQQMPSDLIIPRPYTGDVTPERLQSMLSEQGGRMAVLADEGGIFEVMSGLYSDGRVNIDVFMQSWSGSPSMVDRGGRQVTLLDPMLSFGLTIQPQVLADLSQGSKRKFRGIGCLGRFLFALPESMIGTRDAGKSDTVPIKLRTEYERLINELLEIPPIYEQGQERARSIRLSEEAREAFVKFAQFIESNQGVGQQFEPIQDWTSKLPGQALRVIALSHIAEHKAAASNIAVPVEAVEPVLQFCTRLIEHAVLAFDGIGTDPVLGDAKYAFNWLTNNWHKDEAGRPFLHENELYQTGRFKNDGMERCKKALDVLKDRGIVSQRCKIKTGGRSKQVRYINPALQVRLNRLQ